MYGCRRPALMIAVGQRAVGPAHMLVRVLLREAHTRTHVVHAAHIPSCTALFTATAHLGLASKGLGQEYRSLVLSSVACSVVISPPSSCGSRPRSPFRRSVVLLMERSRCSARGVCEGGVQKRPPLLPLPLPLRTLSTTRSVRSIYTVLPISPPSYPAPPLTDLRSAPPACPLPP